MAEERYHFRKNLTTAHFPIELSNVGKQLDEISLANGVNIIGVKGAVIGHAESDFYDFLNTSLGVIKGSNPVTIELTITSEGLEDVCGYKGRVINITDSGIFVRAFDERGAAQAIYDLEEMMLDRKAPYLKVGKYKNKPLFSPRMAHSAYDLDIFPDGYLQNLAREGIDTLLIFVCGVNQNRLGYIDYNELIDRAEGYGMDVYAYSYLKNFNSPHTADAEKIYEDIYGPIFKEHKKLKGMVFVGESVEFPSSDERTSGRQWFEYEKSPDNIPEGKPSPGWWPCTDYPEWLSLVKKSIRKYKEDADIVFWTYNWGWAPKKERLELLEKLPTDISLLVTFEMFQKREINGIGEMICDYSVSFEGPGDYFLSEAEVAKRRGIRLYSMVNTGGRTWDFGVMPYEPFPQQWQRRFEAIRECHDKYGLCGLMECHHFGYTPSFITKLAKIAFDKYTLSSDQALKRIVDRFSNGETEKCIEALDYWSQMIRKYPANDEEQYCVMRVSTAYPLVLIKPLTPPRLDNDEVMFGNGITEADYRAFDYGRYMPHSMRIRPEIKLFEELIQLIEKGLKIFESIKNPSETVLKLINMGKFMICTYRTNINVKKMFLIRKKLSIAETREEVIELLEQARELGKAEIENAKSSIPLVEYDSALGYEVSMGYGCDKAHIEWKIKQVQYMMNVEIGIYENSINYGEHKEIYIR